MKQKDIALILIVAAVGGVISIVLTQQFFVPKKNKELSVQIVEPIKSEFQQPDNKVFNNNAINPTQLIEIGNGSNANPF